MCKCMGRCAASDASALTQELVHNGINKNITVQPTAKNLINLNDFPLAYQGKLGILLCDGEQHGKLQP